MEYRTWIGIDEVGRGAIAGPVVVGAVLVPPDFSVDATLSLVKIPALRDSKKHSKRQREKLFYYLQEKIYWGIGAVDAATIDTIGLSLALKQGADQAISAVAEQLPNQTYQIVADAGLFHSREDRFPTRRVVKADETILPVTLASIMAKVWRDDLMARFAHTYPNYGWEQNAGYGTKSHLQAISHYGLSPLHRRSFLHG
jgi:ribonuclease HII